MNTNKTILWSLLGVLVIAGAAYYAWSAFMKSPVGLEGENEGTMCTTDAMECPDGSWVGRSGTNCQFVCPIGTSTQSTSGGVFLETQIDKPSSALGVTIKPLSMQDSRCPIGVQCVQAGTVKLKAELTSGMGTATQEFTLNVPITTEAETITLISVRPEAEAGKKIRITDFRFIFKVEKR